MIKYRTNPLILGILSIAALLILPACTIHQLDIQQGNVITKEMTDKLKIGMDKEQVKFVLGTPSINDPFHKNRWDYVYSLKKDTGEQDVKHITVMFEDEKVVRYVGVDVQAGSQVASKSANSDKQEVQAN